MKYFSRTFFFFTFMFNYSLVIAQVVTPEVKPPQTPQVLPPATAWQTMRAWTNKDEEGFGKFITFIGEALEKRYCNTVDNCLKSSKANLFAARNPKGLNFYADCADLPFVLRAYYAWINGLEFSFPSQVVAVSTQDAGKDIRYNTFGNKIAVRTYARIGSDFVKMNRTISNGISTASYRMHPGTETSIYKSSTHFTDFYSPKLSKSALSAGTVVYDPAGHILVIYKITEDGQIKMIDAHPDNSLSRKTYNTSMMRSRPSAGAGFKKWRPVQLNIHPTTGALNAIFVANAQLSDFSLEQFYGTNMPTDLPNDTLWRKGQFILDGKTYDYYDYLRHILSEGTLLINPLVELKNMLADICSEMQDRVQAVQTALDQKIHLKAHPSKLPANIYGTSGEWETYSTPSRDARNKAMLQELMSKVQKWVALDIGGVPVSTDKLDYNGSDLLTDLKNIYQQDTQSCSISYQNSAGKEVALNLWQLIEERIFDLSFDPYHCPELRWGAKLPAELASCLEVQQATSSDKVPWYRAQERLRWQIERTYDQPMGKSLAELQQNPLGVAVKPLIQWAQLELFMAK